MLSMFLELVRTDVGIPCLWRDSKAHHDASHTPYGTVHAHALPLKLLSKGLILFKTPRDFNSFLYPLADMHIDLVGAQQRV